MIAIVFLIIAVVLLFFGVFVQGMGHLLIIAAVLGVIGVVLLAVSRRGGPPTI